MREERKTDRSVPSTAEPQPPDLSVDEMDQQSGRNTYSMHQLTAADQMNNGGNPNRFHTNRVNSQDSNPNSNPKKYERLRSTTLRPYYVWRAKFMDDRCIEKKHLLGELVTSAVPHVLLNLLLLAYVVFGAFFLRFVDESVRKENMRESVLFAFTTITTIGYGSIHPTSMEGKMGCLAYCIVGIPLMFLVLTNNGQFISDAYWILKTSTKREMSDEPAGDLPLWVTCVLLLVHSLVGGLIFSQWIDQMRLVPAIYFSFISIATIGYGDLTPTPETWFQIVVITLYVSVGIVILSTLLGSLSSYLKWIHNIGRPVSGSKDVEVWFGGDMMTVEDLVVMVAEQFQVSTDRLHSVLRDMDEILEAACDRPDLLGKTGEIIRNESMIVREGTGNKVLVTRENSFFHGTPLLRVSSDSSLQRTITRDTANAIHALAVINHKLRKNSLRRCSYSRQYSGNAVAVRKTSLGTPLLLRDHQMTV